MRTSGTMRSIAQPARDAERTYRRQLRSVGADYEQDTIPYQPGFWGQYGASMIPWTLFQIAWWTVSGIAFHASAFDITSRDMLDIVSIMMVAGLWVLPAMVTLVLPLVWWRRYAAMVEFIEQPPRS